MKNSEINCGFVTERRSGVRLRCFFQKTFNRQIFVLRCSEAVTICFLRVCRTYKTDVDFAADGLSVRVNRFEHRVRIRYEPAAARHPLSGAGFALCVLFA